jgi:hypothetical protein
MIHIPSLMDNANYFGTVRVLPPTAYGSPALQGGEGTA